MNTTPDWIHGGEREPEARDSLGVSTLGVIACIAAIVAIAEVLFLTQRFMG